MCACGLDFQGVDVDLTFRVWVWTSRGVGVDLIFRVWTWTSRGVGVDLKGAVSVAQRVWLWTIPSECKCGPQDVCVWTWLLGSV